MEERKIIQTKLKKKEQEIQSLEEKLRSAKIYVQALQDVLRVLESESGTEGGDSGMKPGSAVAKAREIILTLRKPVHINSLLASLGKDVTREAKASLTSSIAAYVRRGEIFTRPAPNTFGLLELGHTTATEPAAPPQPPQGFGKIVPASPPGSDFMEDDIPFGDEDEVKF